MTSWIPLLISVAGGLVLLWALLLVILWRLGRSYDDPARVRDAFRLIPDILRLLRRLLADRTMPTGLRVRVVLLLVYLLSPVDLVPDFIPVIGFADDVILVVLVVRSVTRRAGASAIDRHWPGTADGLRALRHLARVPAGSDG